jgi:hypothetical protein
MPHLRLKTAAVLQGDFQIRTLNLLLVFQVNCPGCFIYALPLAVRLHQQYGDRLNVLGLSTAFEDFDFNTADHTRRLLQHGELVGVTQQYFQHHGESSYGVPIPFPVAFDQLGAGDDLFDDADVEHLCRRNLAFIEASEAAQAQTRDRVKRFLGGKSPAAYTFSVNQLQGTPSWLLFDADFKVLAQWFGHLAESQVVAFIPPSLEPVSLTH